MIKVALVPVLLIVACLLAGVYGALHNQISYTVSPECIGSAGSVKRRGANCLAAKSGK